MYKEYTEIPIENGNRNTKQLRRGQAHSEEKYIEQIIGDKKKKYS